MLLFATLAAVHTWPLAAAPGTWSRNDNGDAQLNAWILAWVAHQLPRDPFGLFDANIFHPARDTLAFSEPLIVPALVAGPVLWLDGSPVLAHNLSLLAGLVLTALASYALVLRWTGDRAAALLGGSLFAFNAHTLTRLAHIQAMHAYGLPLALLFTDRLVTQPTARAAVGLALAMAALAYSSGYLVVFGAVAVGAGILVRWPAWRSRPGAVLGRLVLAAGLAGLIVLPLYLPYRRAAIEQQMVRTLDIVRDYSAEPASYVAAPGRLHLSLWSAPLFERPIDAFFPGLTAAMLVLAGLWSVRRTRAMRGRVAMLVAIGALGVVLSLGLRTPVYGLLFNLFPPMQSLRAAARFGILFLLAVAVLAGIGLAAVRSKTGRRTGAAVALAAILAANGEALRAPFKYHRFEGIPNIYRILAEEPGPVVLVETPFYPPPAVFENAEYVLNSTAHWRPLMNGYSGYTPETYRNVAWTFWYFPEEHAVQAMRQAGVTHVTVHTARFGRDRERTLEALARRQDLELLAVGRGLRLYRFR